MYFDIPITNNSFKQSSHLVTLYLLNIISLNSKKYIEHALKSSVHYV